MALQLNGDKSQITAGVYKGQNNPIYLGPNRKVITSRPGWGTNVCGFEISPDAVKLQAYYDTDYILNNSPPKGLNISKIAYTQMGQLTFNGIPVPMDGAQNYFDQRDAVPNLAYWWIDSPLNNRIKQPFIAEKALLGNPNLKREQFFKYPQSAGNYVRRLSGARSQGDMLCASLLSSAYIDNIPYTFPPIAFQDEVDQLAEDMGFDELPVIGGYAKEGLSLLPVFYDSLYQAIRSTNNPVSQHFVIQYFAASGDKPPAFAVRGTYLHDREITYTFTIEQNGNLTLYRWDVPWGIPDANFSQLMWQHQTVSRLQNWPLGKQYAVIVSLFPTILNDLNKNRQIPYTTFRLQEVADILLIRGIYNDNEEELVYLGKYDPQNPEKLNIYNFDVNLYIELDSTDTDEEADFLGLYTFKLFEELAEDEVELEPYNAGELIQFLGKRGVLAQAFDPDGNLELRYNLLTLVCVVEENGRRQVTKIWLYDGFKWSFARRRPAGGDWSNILFSSNDILPLSQADFAGGQKLLTNFFQKRNQSPEIRW